MGYDWTGVGQHGVGVDHQHAALTLHLLLLYCIMFSHCHVCVLSWVEHYMHHVVYDAALVVVTVGVDWYAFVDYDVMHFGATVLSIFLHLHHLYPP